MLKKLLNGEFSLAATFWKYGVIGLVVVNLVIRIFGVLLRNKIGGISLLDYYTKYFNRVDSWMLGLTLCYFAALMALVTYSFILIKGTWRSSAEYNKSVWLRYLSRILILVMVAISFKMVL